VKNLKSKADFAPPNQLINKVLLSEGALECPNYRYCAPLPGWVLALPFVYFKNALRWVLPAVCDMSRREYPIREVGIPYSVDVFELDGKK